MLIVVISAADCHVSIASCILVQLWVLRIENWALLLMGFANENGFGIWSQFGSSFLMHTAKECPACERVSRSRGNRLFLASIFGRTASSFNTRWDRGQIPLWILVSDSFSRSQKALPPKSLYRFCINFGIEVDGALESVIDYFYCWTEGWGWGANLRIKSK